MKLHELEPATDPDQADEEDRPERLVDVVAPDQVRDAAEHPPRLAAATRSASEQPGEPGLDRLRRLRRARIVVTRVRLARRARTLTGSV